MSGRALQRHRRACALVVLLSALSALGVEPRAAAAQDHGTAELSPSPVFVVGDRSARAGETVTFHADSWAERNSLSGGAAPAAFKGFAGDLETTPPAPGQRWSAKPGHADPPAAVPAYMGAVVAQTITKSGSGIAGDVHRIAVIRTNGGYSRHLGTPSDGVLVALLVP